MEQPHKVRLRNCTSFCAEMEAGAGLGKDVVVVLGSVKWMPLSPRGFLCCRNYETKMGGGGMVSVILQFGKSWKAGKREKIDCGNE